MTNRVVAYSGPPDAMATLRAAVGKQFEVSLVEPTPAGVVSGLKEACVFMDASMKVPINEAVIESAPRLQLVVTATTGADHIDSDALERRDIPLLTLRGQSEILNQLTPAAEHSWLLLMACARQLRPALEHVLQGGWTRADFPGTMLKGRTLGLVGCGRLGQFMASYAQPFGMNVLGYDPYLQSWPTMIDRVTQVNDLLAVADFVSIHVPLNQETRLLMNREHLARMKFGAILVNTSRGDVIDEIALLELLQQGHIAGVGLDVLSGEPEVREHPLRVYATNHPNVIITPHIGGFAPDAVKLVVAFSGQRILNHFGLKA